MREDRRTVHAAVADVVSELALFRIKTGHVPHPLGDLMIRTCGVAAETESADPCLVPVERDASAERDRAAAHLPVRALRILRRDDAVGLEGIGFGNAPQRVLRLRQCIEARGRARL